jgi:hypothetical protein
MQDKRNLFLKLLGLCSNDFVVGDIGVGSNSERIRSGEFGGFIGLRK